MRGFGRGAGLGRGAGWVRSASFAPSLPGYDYVGSCSCGFGPNAYYRSSSGQILPASALYSGVGQSSSAIEQLKAEKADLERRLRDLESRLQATT